VLVVHHVAALRDSFAHALCAAGCYVADVADFARAAEVATGDPPDVVVTDEVEIGEAPAAFRSLRDAFGNVLVVALTRPVKDRRAPPDHDVDCCIESPGELASAVRWVLDVYANEHASGDAGPGDE
jgi:CheY-like chemotaxis protein